MPTNNRPPTKVEYEAILNEFKKNRLEDAVALMEQIPAYQRKTPLFRQQLFALTEAKISNITPETSRNRISNGLLTFIQIHEPQEAYAPQEPPTPQTSTQAHAITNPDASLLWVSRNFLGRDGKIAEISGILNRQEGGALIVTGMAGNGKTTICHHVLRQWLQDAPDRVVYLVQVEFITTVAGLARALGSLCGLKPELATPDNVLTALTDLPIGILYLDNLESVLDDPEAHQFLGRLKLCTNLTFLASSRREVAGFARIRLDVLDEPDAIELFQLIWQQQTGKRIGDQELSLLQDFVANDLGCHPISIEVTASHAETVGTIHQLVEEFRDSKTTYFTRYASDKEGRLDNLFQSLGLSLNRLQGWPNAIRLLALCAVYESGLSGPMQKLLLQADIFTPSDRSLLMERNLVRYKEGFLSVLPPMVRFIRSVLTTENGLFDKNILFQDSECVAKADSIPVPNRLEFLGFYAKSKRYDLEQVFNSFDNTDFLNHLFLAHPILEQLIENTIFCSSAKQNVYGNVFEYLGQIDFRKGNNDNARKRYQQADELYRKIGSDQGCANILRNLGDIDFLEGNNDEARKRYHQADELYRKTGDDQGRANVSTNLGRIDLLERNNDEARKRYQQADELYRKAGDDQGRANTSTLLGQIDLLEGKNDEARKRFQQADELFSKTGSDHGRAIVLAYLGQIDLREGNNDKARKRYQQADELFGKTGNDYGRANVHHYLAIIAQAEKDYPVAQARWLKALKLYRKVTANRDVAETLLFLSDINLEVKAPSSELAELLTEAAQLIEQFDLAHLNDKLKRLQSHLTE
jgi:tetratricopeptide (TPR) repeat protein